MRIALFGATGRTGLPLCRQAIDRGHEVVAHARSPAASNWGPCADAITVVEGDAYTGEGVGDAVAGADAVVSVLGQGAGSPDDLLTVAGDHVVDAMNDHDVDRFVTLVGAGVRDDGETVSLGGRVMGVALKLLAGSVHEDAADAR